MITYPTLMLHLKKTEQLKSTAVLRETRFGFAYCQEVNGQEFEHLM